MPPADIGLGILFGLGRFLAAPQLGFVEPRAQHAHCLGPVAVLRPVALTGDDDAGRNMRDSDRAVGGIDVLAARPLRPVGIDPQVARVDIDFDLVVDLGIDPDGGKTGMPARA